MLLNCMSLCLLEADEDGVQATGYRDGYEQYQRKLIA
jgi:hypothetical protein